MITSNSRLKWTVALLLLTLVSANPAGAWKKKKGHTVTGYLWATLTSPAPGKQVILLDAGTGEPVQTDTSNLFGKFKFKHVAPGAYIVRAGRFSRKILVRDKTVRVHFNFSSPDGQVDFVAAARENGKVADEMTGAAAADPGPSDPALVRWIAGEYYSYQGSTERKLMLCAGGIFYDSRESSYSGTNYDSLGNETSAYGAASTDAGNGKWAIKGNRQSGTITFSYKGKGLNRYAYRNIGDNCFLIGQVKFCYAGPPRCR